MSRPNAIKLFLPCVALLITAGCTRHVRLEMPATTAASSYTCTSENGCEPATSDVPADANQRGTTFVTLPEQCGGSIHRVVIHDAQSPDPEVVVTCAPPEPEDDKIPEME